MKICKKCGLEKEFIEFYKRKGSKDGYRNECIICNKNSRNKFLDKIRYKKYYLENREYFLNKAKNEKLRKRNLNSKRIRIKEINKNIGNNEKICSRCMIIKEKTSFNKDSNTKDGLNSYCIECRNKQMIDRKKLDKLYDLKCKIRILFAKCFYKYSKKKKIKSEIILGCSFGDFKLYLESKFENWMNWENKGLYNGEFNYGWDIDHIIPLSSAKTEEDIIKLNHYTNLQPLCSKVNRDIKKDHLIGQKVAE